MKTRYILVLCFGFVISLFSADYTVGTDTWDFENFSLTTDTDKLWELFQRAFLDVGTDYATAANDDQVFFDNIIMQYSGHGCCFGMSILSAICYFEGGHLSACSPVVQYEGDDVNGPDLQAIRDAISIMHLRQLGKNVVSELIDKFDSNNWNDPNDALNEAEYYLSSGDLPVLCLLPSAPAAFTQISNGDNEAHVIVPYDVEHSPERIYCYDPNFTYSGDPDFYEGATQENYIQLGSSPSYSWVFPAGYTSSSSYGWSGSMTSGPWAYIILPYSLAKYKDNHPLDVGWALSEINSILFFGDGDVSQISDNQGKSFYKTTGGKLAYETSPSKKLYGMIRWPFFLKNKDGIPAELYFGKHMQGKSYQVELDSKGKPYTCQVLLADQHLKIEASQAMAGREMCTIKSIGTRDQAFEVTSNRKLANVKLELLKLQPDKKTIRTFKVSKISFQPNAPIQIGFVEREEGLQIRSEKAPVSYDVEIIKKVHDKETRIAPQHIDMQMDQESIVRPLDWQNLDVKQLQIQKRDIKKGSGFQK